MYWYYPFYTNSHTQAETSQRVDRIFSEDLLQRNIGRNVTVYLTHEENPKWSAQIVKGRLKEVGRDFILVTDQATGKDTLLFNVSIDYIVFD